MIGSLTGQIAAIHKSSLLLETAAGIGYTIEVPASVLRMIADNALSAIRVVTHPIFKEDGQSLFGFITEEEKATFLVLLGVSGVGPRSALNLISKLTPIEIAGAVADGNKKLFESVQGIGPKAAERLVVELKNKKIGNIDLQGLSPLQSDISNALINLGTQPGVARNLASKVPSTCTNLSDGLAQALRMRPATTQSKLL